MTPAPTPPPQYNPRGRCDRCMRQLSRYNQYRFCSGCRQALYRDGHMFWEKRLRKAVENPVMELAGVLPPDAEELPLA